MNDQRNTGDRRTRFATIMDISPDLNNDRRRSADRRLNNIKAEWIPMGKLHSHPVTKRLFKAS
jgi:hypothetical protein